MTNEELAKKYFDAANAIEDVCTSFSQNKQFSGGGAERIWTISELSTLCRIFRRQGRELEGSIKEQWLLDLFLTTSQPFKEELCKQLARSGNNDIFNSLKEVAETLHENQHFTPTNTN